MLAKEFVKIFQCMPSKRCGKLANNIRMTTRRYLQHPRKNVSITTLRAYCLFRPMFGVALPFSFVLHSLSKQEENLANELKIIKAADELYDAAKYEDLYELLNTERESENPEILWRLARALFEKCRTFPNKEKLEMLEEAYGFVQKALDINNDCSPAHKWYAILTDYVWRNKGTKGRIIHCFDTRKHMEKAIELNPEDSTSYYLLGTWCFSFADMPWYQRRVASLIFATPPTSTYEEALGYFQEAEKISRNFYSMNLLMLGKCFLKLNEIEKAKEYLIQARDYPIKTPDDEAAHAEALILLKGLGIQ